MVQIFEWLHNWKFPCMASTGWARRTGKGRAGSRWRPPANKRLHTADSKRGAE